MAFTKMDLKRLCFNCMSQLPEANCVCPKCGFDNKDRHTDKGLISNYIINGRYYLGRKLGRGGFGVTYIGYDMQLNRSVAVKEYYPENSAYRAEDGVTIKSTTPDKKGSFEYGLTKAIEEGRKAAAVDKIPGVVRMYDCVEANGTVYLVMEYIEGETIRGNIKRNGPQTAEQMYEIIGPIMRTLEEVHGEKMIHRDISPDNIVIEKRSRQAILLDFGAARSIEGNGIGTGTVTVRHGYAPVEQYSRNGRLDERADEYALSATMYYMLTGKDPTPSVERLSDGLKLPSALGSKISPATEKVLMKGLAIKAEERYDTMTELRIAMDKTLKPAKEKAAPSSEKKSGGKKGTAVIVGAVIAVIAVIAAIVIGQLSAKGWECLECGAKNDAALKYCGACGIEAGCTASPEPADTRWECLECGTKNAAEMKYCGNCAVEANCTATPKPAAGAYQAGDHVYLGSYEQDGIAENGAEAIEWRILAANGDGTYLLISEKGLEAKAYSEENDEVSWDMCTLRSWLNGAFYGEAFSDAEQAQIVASDTQDQVYLPSIEEINGYLANDGERICYPTANAEDHGAYTSSNGACWWWLRSPGADQGLAAYVSYDGSVCDDGFYVSNAAACVRPVVCARLS